MMAGDSGYIKVCELLLGKNAKFNKMGNNGMITLHWAALEGRTRVCSLLLECGALIADKGNKWNMTALQWAQHHGDTTTFLQNYSTE